ncbi:Rad21/Rec8-like protein [Chloropicon primus]|uniref:Rad21/Rec8-like protein n=1 Tax=Chloropicon primus TaxID=1764295 RepID=A0A5B8MV00_9CHLO|nr:Rad21/Rec8-like protein [Chloropicon primus]UPR03325.1 Rad21/Rec8-like protein [Chloropicon primus]|mmetsp:Transcript_14532/g.41397  ORF Transcript_14532/g.41397 Transcript_14532/m.41397 type:complete len:571 (-) Transcript_14532:105-1817(-)|eukprot:QDZ24116.1 Rad21/Rec8-like protein [Chloropicon primus]
MFYHIQILAKKGPLGTIWIAAHHDKRLKRSQVFETQISNTIDSIITPEVPLALRLSGQLMLGIVRIYARKVSYLFQDCSQGYKGFKVQENVNLSKEALQSSVQAITLPEIEEDPDFTQDDALGFGGAGGLSLPGTPISLAGSLAGTPEKLRRASIGSEGGLRKSLSFESPGGSYNSMDVDMMYTDEQFGDEGLGFDLEPEKLRSEEPVGVGTPTRDAGRTTLTPVQEGQQAVGMSTPELEEVPDFAGVEAEDNGGLAGDFLATPEAVLPSAEKDLPRKKKQRVVGIILDVDDEGSKQISLDNKVVRSRLKNAKDTLRNLKKDISRAIARSKSQRAPKRAKTARSARRKSGSKATQAELLCEDLLGVLSAEESAEEVQDPEAGEQSGEGGQQEEDQGVAYDEVGEGLEFDPYANTFEEQFDVPADTSSPVAGATPKGDEGRGQQPADFLGAGDLSEEENQEDDDDVLNADEDGWSSRTKQTLERVKAKLSTSTPTASRSRSSRSPSTLSAASSCKFEDILPDSELDKPLRRDVARNFFECLVLNTKGYINLKQVESFGALTITPRDLLIQS